MLRSLSNKISVALMGAGIGALIGAAVLFALATWGPLGDGDSGNSGPGTVTGFGSVLVTPPATTPTPPPGAPPSEAPIERLTIPKIEVDAPVVVLGIDGDGVMQSPNNAFDVAWYNFSARPGFGSNAVFSGHVDYHDVGPAVFWDLRNLEPGDLIEVRLADGTVYSYSVTAMDSFTASDAPVAEIVGPTPTEAITLITCGGTFDSNARQYSDRVVVRAERVGSLAPGG